jgi:hypothetical protein
MTKRLEKGHEEGFVYCVKEHVMPLARSKADKQ